MDEDQNVFNEEVSEQGANAGVENGAGTGETDDQSAFEESQGNADKDDPYGVKKRLGMQAKKHQREMRQMQEQMMHMQNSMMSRDSAEPPLPHNNPYPSPGQPSAPGMSEEERIQKAVRYALGAKEHEERQAVEHERKAHVHKQYQRLNDEFDRHADKYDDFDELVRGDDVPFSHHVRDALLLVDNPGEVAYRLGKNRSELERISKLHPLDQAREVNKLSFSLMNNGGKAQAAKTNPMAPIKGNPMGGNSGAITDKTPASVIRARMKAGTWK